MVTPRNYVGTRDLLGRQAIVKEWAIGRIRSVMQKYGFDPQETPGIEMAETLAGKTGGETGHNIFFFSTAGTDEEPGGDRVGLRFDLTVPLARVVAQHGPDLPVPYKRYQIGQVWRHDKPSMVQERYREFTQFDADIVGTTSIDADAEIMTLLCDGLTTLGFKGVKVTINNRKIMMGLCPFLGIDEEQLLMVQRSIDKLAKVGEAGVEAELRSQRYADVEEPGKGLVNKSIGEWLTAEQWARLRPLLSLEGSNLEKLDYLAHLLVSAQAAEGIDEIRQILAYLPIMGVASDQCRYDFTLARGLDYYTGPIFETTVEGVPSSISGGGRFNELASVFGAVDAPGTGTSFGVDRIVSLLMSRDMVPFLGRTHTSVLVTVFNPECKAMSLRALHDLRQAGIAAELSLTGGKLGEQLAYANKRGIGAAVIIGPDEAAAMNVTVRRLTQERVDDTDRSVILAKGRQKQTTVPFMDLVSTVQNL